MNHLTQIELQGFVDGQASPADVERIMAHLDQCEQCLAVADRLWEQHPASDMARELMELDGPTAQRLERQLVNQIHRSNLAGTVFRLGTQGFFSVAAGLLRPLTRPRRVAVPENSGGRRPDEGHSNRQGEQDDRSIRPTRGI